MDTGCVYQPLHGGTIGMVLIMAVTVNVWADTVRYLGVFIVSCSCFSYSFDNAKKSFYRVFNAVFGKVRVGRVVSQNVVIELLMSKCVPVLYYVSECCPISKSQFNSLEFAFMDLS